MLSQVKACEDRLVQVILGNPRLCQYISDYFRLRMFVCLGREISR
jgi:hypothetical protein